jgi:hypothetical protein
MMKSIELSLLMILISSALHSMESEIVDLSDILNAKFGQIKTLKKGQQITVTKKNNATLRKWIILDKEGHTCFNSNRSIKASIIPALYALKNDSQLNTEYQWLHPDDFVLFNSGIVTTKILTAHQLKLCPLEKVGSNSYDLDIIYLHPNEPEQETHYFALKAYKADINDDSGVEK